MPRCARIKSEDSIYHIMIRSISEIDLFKDNEDKLIYFSLIKKYINKFQFKVYAYCLMDNHGHLIIDGNGADISRIMHAINFSYAQYYNRKYKRYGHVFQDRFKSKIIDNDKYFITLSAYIHNNPKDLKEYKNNILIYPFSSLKAYIYGTNELEILDKNFLEEILSLNTNKNKKAYLLFVRKCSSEDEQLDIEFQETNCEYRSERKILSRDYTPQEVIRFIAHYTKIHENKIYIKYSKNYTKIRAVSCFLMHCFCNISQRNICHILGNITQSRVSKLSILGQNIAFSDEAYMGIIDDFIKSA